VLSLIIHFLTALIQDLEINKGEEMNLKTTLRLIAVATLFTMIGMGTMIMAFITGIYAILVPSLRLVISTSCLIGLIFFFLVYLVLGSFTRIYDI
jgi:Mg2+ and Co2+ transporter CorA